MNNIVNNIKNNLDGILARIKDCAEQAGRDAEDVKLITVTKAQQLEVVEAAIQAGAIRLGENYPVEAVEKISALKEYNSVEWHMIGHLQSRKSALIVENFNYFHSLDSLKLAQKINRILSDNGKIMPVLLELNISGEESKFGWPAWKNESIDRLMFDVEKILLLNNIKIKGLMTMPPYSKDTEKARPYFKRMSEILGFLAEKFPETEWLELSMGTSVDFEVAIQEGATFVRVGTAIVGPRDYQKKN